jgi:hypothetical protein
MGKNYIPVLCCSSKKNKDWFSYKGQDIKFVASPQIALKDEFTYYKPDDPIPGENRTWRDLVLNGQNDPKLDLVPAYELYSRDIYRDLYLEFGNRFYILSAGWGIIRADFKIPAYDITYSTAPKAPKYAKRKDNHGWKDINHLTVDVSAKKFKPDSEVILFAGSDYVSPFCAMVQSIPYPPYRKTIVYKSEKVRRMSEQRPEFHYEFFKTSNNTGWVYEAAASKILNKKRLQPFDLNESKEYKELKSKYHELCNIYHPDHLDEKDKASGQRIFCEVKDAWDNKDYIELENIYEKYKQTKSNELRQESQEKEQIYYQQEFYDDYIPEQETPYESSPHRSEESAGKNAFAALLVSIIAGIIFLNFIQGCPVKKESTPNRRPAPSPRVEYVLPKSEGSSITVKSDILTKYFGISYEQRQRSNLFMKDSHEYRYNGNGTWTITKKGAINNTSKNRIDTNNKNEVENYLHSLGF